MTEQHGPGDARPLGRDVEPWEGMQTWQLDAPAPSERAVLYVGFAEPLSDRCDDLIHWLESARAAIVQPLIQTTDAHLVRTKIGRFAQISGPPHGLLVTMDGWNAKGRPAFGSGDEGGWTRMMNKLRQRAMVEATLHARALDEAGNHRWDARGFVRLEARTEVPPSRMPYAFSGDASHVRIEATRELIASSVPDLDGVLSNLAHSGAALAEVARGYLEPRVRGQQPVDIGDAPVTRHRLWSS